MSMENTPITLVESMEDVNEFSRWLSEKREWLAFDTETGGLSFYDKELRLAQLGDASGAWVFQWNRWSGAVIEALDKFEGKIVGHNIGFDSRFYQHHSGKAFPWHKAYDTMVMAHNLDPTKSKALKTLGAQFLSPEGKKLQTALNSAMKQQGWGWDTIPLDFPIYWGYAGVDCILTAKLAEQFWPQIESQYKNVFDLEMQVSRICSNMEVRGINLDLNYVEQSYEKLTNYCKLFEETFWNNFNMLPTQNDKVAQLLIDQGAQLSKLTATGRVSMDEEALSGVEHPLAKQLIEYRKAKKIANTYFKNFLEMHHNGIIHPSINTLGARTGRMSTNNPAAQTFPRGSIVRNCFVPFSEQSLYSIDYSGIEARLFSHFAGEEELIRVFHEGFDPHTYAAQQVFGVEEVTKEQRQIAKNCVPLDTEILTATGWKKHDEVKVGDLTLTHQGWEPIQGIIHIDSAELIKISNSHWEAITTPDHRWLSKKRHHCKKGDWFSEEFVTTWEINREDSLIVTPPDVRPPYVLSITPTEAAIIGWAMCDGSISWSEKFGGTSNSFGNKRAVQMRIFQSKPEGVKEIESLLLNESSNYQKTLKPPEGKNLSGRTRDSMPCWVWTFNQEWARNLLRKGDLEYGTLEDFVLHLSSESRKAFLNACLTADGDIKTKTQFYQNEGDTLNAVRLAWYLEGQLVKGSWRQNPNAKHWHSKISTKTKITGQRLVKTSLGEAPVWCVQTESGTWTMRQQHRISLTGNCTFALLYGAGPEKMGFTAGISSSDAKAFIDAYKARFPGVAKFMKTVEKVATQRMIQDGRAWVKSPIGRIHYSDKSKIYTLVNSLVQGTSADVFKQSLVNLDNAGYGEYMCLPIHDEVLFSFPHDINIQDVVATMEDRNTFRVPLVCEASGPYQRWGEKYDT